MRVGTKGQTYEWLEDWAELPHDQTAQRGWSHHDMVVTASGDVVAFHQTEPVLLVFDAAGRPVRSVPVEVREAHGMTLVRDPDGEKLWVADVGHKISADGSGGLAFERGERGTQVVKLAMDGRVEQRLDRPAIAAYDDGKYVPTAVAVDEERHGGSGDVWVADGYGESYLHRFDRDGKLIASFNGEEGGAGRFNCPHAVFVDRRRNEAELYVADRGNARVVVLGLSGEFRRVVGADFLNSPSALASFGQYLVVAELYARLAICDAEDQVVCYLGENGEVASSDGWPNSKDADGKVLRSQLLEKGKFNSPHGLATDADGNIYVSEWLIGGRVVKLARV